MLLQALFSPLHVLDNKENATRPANKPALLPGVPQAPQQARNPEQGRPQSLTPCSRDLPWEPSPRGACAHTAGTLRQEAKPKEMQGFRPELLLAPLDMVEPQQLGPSQTLLEDPVQALGQDVGLLIALTALLPAFWHLFHPIVGAGNGPSHGGDGVCVPTK